MILMTCYLHPGVGSIAKCANCGKEICAACATDFNDAVVCRDCAVKLRRDAELPVVKAENAPVTAPAPKGEIQPASQPTSVPVPKPSAVPSAAPVAPAPERKEPLISLLLSIIVPGFGQLYNGEMLKGIILVVAYTASWFITLLSYRYVRVLCCGFILLPLLIILFGAYDAYSTANKLNKR